MKNNNTCFLTTVFPCPLEYLISFFDSLVDQDISAFDVVIVNDGNNELTELLTHYPLLNTCILQAGKSPIENREFLVKFAIENSYEFAVFGDSDDTFSHNRVSESLNRLKNVDIVVNDITTFTSIGISQSNYISNRFENSQNITLGNILHSNIFGLSNTAVRVKVLSDLPFPFCRELIALDWYIFSILLHSKYLTVFTNNAITYYRQHSDNIAGLGECTQQTRNRSLAVKKAHYSALADLLDLDTYKILRDNSADQSFMIKRNSKKISKTHFPLWWEH